MTGRDFDAFGEAPTRSWGEGNYRLIVDTTDRSFLDPSGLSLERRSAILASCDQQFGRAVGGFVRIGRQTDDAAVDYAVIYSGGVSLEGRTWKSVSLTDDNLAGSDLVLITTAHRGIDYERVVRLAPRVLDTRNATADVGPAPNVEKL